MRSTFSLAAVALVGFLATDGCRAATETAAKTWYKPTPSDTLLWSLSEIIPANPKDSKGKAMSQNIYGIDLFDISKDQITEYHKLGKKVSCYFSAGSFEDGRPDSGKFKSECYCNKSENCKMEGWEEFWFDLHSSTCIKNVQSIMYDRLTLAKSKGCDLVEPDNLDSYDNVSGWKTTAAEQYNYLKFLSDTAHAKGLGIALKNSARMIEERGSAFVKMWDFVIIEECQQYNDCEAYLPFVTAKKPAFDFEYKRSITCSLAGFSVTVYSEYMVKLSNIVNWCRKAA